MPLSRAVFRFGASAAGVALLVGAACSSDEKGSSSGSLLPEDVLATVFVQRVARNSNGNVFDYDSYVPGGAIIKLEPPSPNGKLTNLTALAAEKANAAGAQVDFSQADVMSWDLSFDAQQIAFSARLTADDHYQLFTMNVAGSNLRQVTADDHDYVFPTFVPGQKLLFTTNQSVEEGSPQFQDEYERATTSQVGTVNLDGTNMVLGARNVSHRVAPSLLSDGHVIYTEWEHLGTKNDGHLRMMNADMTGMKEAFGGELKADSQGQTNSYLRARYVDTYTTADGKSADRVVAIGTSRDRTLQAGKLLLISHTSLHRVGSASRRTKKIMTVPRQHTILAAVCLASFAGASACAKVADGEPPGTGSGAHEGTGGRSGPGSGGIVGGLDAAADQGPIEKFAGEVKTCTDLKYMFEPKVPTVILLVDRSGSMFHCLTGSTGDPVCSDLTNTTWSKLKGAIEPVMAQLDAQVRFGFMTVWGTNPTGGGMCPSLKGMATDVVPAALSNAATIAKAYDALPPAPNSTEVGKKFESPASESIAVATKTLMADTSVGDKYIIFLTDGQPDYCDDSNPLCAPDSVVFQLQNGFRAGIKTIVFGVQTALFDLAPGVLQAFANAGAGEPTLPPVKTGGSTNDFYDQCSGIAGWAADLTASGKSSARGATLGTYSTTMGPTTPYTPSAANQSELVSQLSAALSGVKSCTFDLGNIDGKSVKVDRTMLSDAHIKIMGTEIPLNDTNGWRMATDTQLELTGSACDMWREPATTTIDFIFPCEVFIVA